MWNIYERMLIWLRNVISLRNTKHDAFMITLIRILPTNWMPFIVESDETETVSDVLELIAASKASPLQNEIFGVYRISEIISFSAISFRDSILISTVN